MWFEAGVMSMPSEEVGSDGRSVGWTLEEDAMYQLDQLNAMRRQQDINYWSSSAVFGVATVYLLIAALDMANDKDHIALVLVGFLGLVVSFFWLAVVKHANDHGNRWRDKAMILQNNYGIPDAYRTWSKCPPGIVSKWHTMVLVITGSALIWYSIVAYACLMVSLSCLVIWVVFIQALIVTFRFGYFRAFLRKVAEFFEVFWSPKSLRAK